MRLLTVLLFGFLVTTCSQPRPTWLIIDADTANEVDDLFAIVGAIANAPEGDVNHKIIGITSAQFHTSPLAGPTTVLESQRINEDIVRLLKRPDIATPVGSNLPLMDAVSPAISPASTFIIERAHAERKSGPLEVFILGPCTNVASAILQDPTIIPKIRVNYLGFWYDPATKVFDKKEFNSGNDTFAVNLLLNTEGLDFKVMTATTSQHLVFQRNAVEKQLRGKGPVADYLLHRWDTYDRWWTDEDPDKKKWTMWDVALLDAYFHPELATLERRKAPPENGYRDIGVYTSIKQDTMEAGYWAELKGFWE